jgi:hypothetical protein
MKIPIVCSQCMTESSPTANFLEFVEFRDDGRYESTCPSNHKSVVILQQQKVELLFEIGAYALLDGYYREAVTSFTSCLERFYEFFMNVICIEKVIDEEAYKKAWDLITRQSERQLGAFVFTYLLEYGKSPILIDDKKVAFRNKVIHEGKIPTRQEAINYGQSVLDFIRPILGELKENYSKSIRQTIFQHVKKCRDLGGRDIPHSSLAIKTIISLSVEDQGYDTQPLDEILTSKRKWWESFTKEFLMERGGIE